MPLQGRLQQKSLFLKKMLDAVREYAASVQGAWREEYAGTDEGITVTVEE